MKTSSETIRDIANRLDEIESDVFRGMTPKTKYGNVVPSHEPDIHAMDFLNLMDEWKERILLFGDVEDERLKHDLLLWLEVFKNQIQQLR